MINKITLIGVASYGVNPVLLETDKKINLIYGLNGTGKTTISKYLQNKNHLDFSKCSIEGLNQEKILVYNQKFIDDSFYQDTQKGIFSLKSENKEAKEKIEKSIEEINKLNLIIKNDSDKTGLTYEKVKKTKDKEDLQTITEEKTWEIKTKYTGGDRILEFCLERKMGSKKALLEYIISITKSSIKPSKTIEELKKEADDTQGTGAKIYDTDNLKINIFDFWKIENNDIFKDVIIGNENSQVSKLIEKLNNSDWVKRGTEYISLPQFENGICPFCQQKTISNELYQEIQNYFDKSYQQKIIELENLNNTYFNNFQKCKEIENLYL